MILSNIPVLGLSFAFEQLAGLRRKFAMGRITEPYFTPQELAHGKQAAEAALDGAKQRKKAEKADSLSRR